MSKERELLKRVIDALHEIKETHYDLFWDIKAYLDQPEPEPDIDYIVKEIHKKCFQQSLNTAPVITVRHALSIFREHLKNKRVQKREPLSDDKLKIEE